MKFTPESLIEIYLNGSFTEEAQEEFNALMRTDPAFAQKVTDSVAERLGPVPAELEDQIARRLDSKMDSLWRAHRPSPWGGLLKLTLKAVVLLAAVGGVYQAARHFGVQNQSSSVVEDSSSSGLIRQPVTARGEDSSPALSERKNSIPASSAKGKKTRPTLSLSFKEGTAADRSSLSAAGTAGSQAMKPAEGRPSAAVEQHAQLGPAGVRAEKESLSPLAGSPSSEEGDALRVSIEMEKAGKVIITVLDSNGLLVRGLYQGVWNPGLHLLDWDGKDEAGNQVQPGNYTVAVNADGKTMSGTLVIRADR